jgi:ERCC4-type nuclease
VTTSEQTPASGPTARRRIGKKDVADFVIAVDTREQRPYRFQRAVVKTLLTGDYSIVGLEERVAIERKTKEDAYSSLGRGRARFARELARLARFDYAAIVIESSLPEFLSAPAFSRMNPKAAIRSIVAWSVRYRIGVFFAGDRPHGNALTLQLLEKYWRYHDTGDADAR